eukprot:3850780-Prymnesium_polylepis.1
MGNRWCRGRERSKIVRTANHRTPPCAEREPYSCPAWNEETVTPTADTCHVREALLARTPEGP